MKGLESSGGYGGFISAASQDVPNPTTVSHLIALPAGAHRCDLRVEDASGTMQVIATRAFTQG
jgi:hypothetical protein